MTRASSARGNNNTAGHTHKKGKRGAPQTFARKLFNILHEGTPIVGWSEGGDSFTVHNDKDFERDILTAHYRHGKFSSFQRQLNMYGFRKVADCSDRTYSHPYFRRNQAELLSQVRRVTAADNNTNDRNKKRPAAMATPTPAAAAAAARQEDEGEDDGSSHTTGESDAGDNESASMPPRKKPRCFIEQAAGAEAAGGGGLLRRPLQYWVDADFSGVSAVGGCGTPVPTAMNAAAGEVTGNGVRLNQSQVESQQQQQQQQMANVGASVARRPEYSGAWHQHTGLWGGVSNMDDAWTSCSSSAPPSVEASSPVLLPINATDLDCKNSADLPPFKLVDSELPVSSATNDMGINNNPSFVGTMLSSTGLGGVNVDWGARSPSDAASVGGIVDASLARCGSSPAVQAPSLVNASAGLFYGAWNNNGRAGCDVGAAAAEEGGKAGPAGENPLCLDKAFAFGEALARCPSFELIFDANDLVLDPAATGGDDTPVPISPTSSSAEDETAKREVAASTARTATAGSVGWDLANLGGAGWGSPETAVSAAAGPWAALPPWGSPERASRPSLAPVGQEPAVGNNVTSGLNKHDGAASVIEGGGSYSEPNVVRGAHQQLGGGGGLHKRTLSTILPFSLGLGGDSSSAVDQLDWALLADADTATVNADYVPSLGGLADAGGGGGGFGDGAAFPEMEVGAAPVRTSSAFSLLGVGAAASFSAAAEVSPVTSCESSSACSPIVDESTTGMGGVMDATTLITGRRRSFVGVDDVWGLGLSEPREPAFA